MKKNEFLSFKNIVNLLPENIYWLDKNNVYQGCNLKQLQFFNCSSVDEIVGKKNADLFSELPRDFVEQIDNNNRQVISTGKIAIFEEIVKLATGENAFFLSHKIPLIDKNDHVYGLLGISTNITEVRKKEDILKNRVEQAELAIENIVANMPGHVYWKNVEGVYLGCNDLQAQMLNLQHGSQVVGKTDYQLPWSEASAQAFRENDLRIMSTGIAETIEEPVQVNGKKLIVISHKTPIKNKDGKILGILGISIDITKRKDVEAELMLAKEAAEAASLAKTQFLENMRHDIRTPLTGIVGFAEIIKAGVKNPKIKAYADNLVEASNMLLEFLNEVLEAIRVLTGDIPTVKRKFPLQDAFEKVIQLLKPKAIEKHLKLHISFDKKLPKYVVGDPTRMQRIFLELLSNALNFTKKGFVNVKFELAKQEDNNLVIRIVVEDSGIGIPLDKQDEIFLRFKRLTPSYEGIYKGAGLGLSILKQFVDDLNGEISCRSTIDEGTTFICLLPIKKALLDDATDVLEISPIKVVEHRKNVQIQTSVKNQPMPSMVKTRVLVVEDNQLAAMAAESIITVLDCSVDVAVDGFSALKRVNENQYDLIFMDIGLPDHSGIDVTRQIRTKEWNAGKHVPIIGLTAHIDTEKKQQCIEAGMDAVLSKPLQADTAEDIINAFVPARKITINKSEVISDPAGINGILSLTGNAVDLEMGVKKTGNLQSAKQMINLFLEGFRNDFLQLEAARNKNDWNMVKSFVHKHRGGSIYCGLPRFQQISSYLEEYLESKKTENIELLYQQFLEEVENIRKEMKLMT